MDVAFIDMEVEVTIGQEGAIIEGVATKEETAQGVIAEKALEVAPTDEVN